MTGWSCPPQQICYSHTQTLRHDWLILPSSADLLQPHPETDTWLADPALLHRSVTATPRHWHMTGWSCPPPQICYSHTQTLRQYWTCAHDRASISAPSISTLHCPTIHLLGFLFAVLSTAQQFTFWASFSQYSPLPNNSPSGLPFRHGPMAGPTSTSLGPMAGLTIASLDPMAGPTSASLGPMAGPTSASLGPMAGPTIASLGPSSSSSSSWHSQSTWSRPLGRCLTKRIDCVVIAESAWYLVSLEDAHWPCTSDFSPLGFCRGCPALSSWPACPALWAQGARGFNAPLTRVVIPSLDIWGIWWGKQRHLLPHPVLLGTPPVGPGLLIRPGRPGLYRS